MKKSKPIKKAKPLTRNKIKDEIVFNVSDAELKRVASLHAKNPSEALASLTSRFTAKLIDFFPICLYWILKEDSFFEKHSKDYILIIPVIISILVFVIAQILLLANHGQSIGKYFLKIQMLDVRTGEKGNLVRLFFLRPLLFGPHLPNSIDTSIAWMVFYSFYFVVGLIDVSFIFRKNRRCLHDYLAETAVINCEYADVFKVKVEQTSGEYWK